MKTVQRKSEQRQCGVKGKDLVITTGTFQKENEVRGKEGSAARHHRKHRDGALFLRGALCGGDNAGEERRCSPGESAVTLNLT